MLELDMRSKLEYFKEDKDVNACDRLFSLILNGWFIFEDTLYILLFKGKEH